MSVAAENTSPLRPTVCVLMATHNGAAWLDAQIDSVLAQQGVDVRLCVCDDASTDGTCELLQARAAADGRVRVLEHAQRFGSAARNFFHLIRHAPIDAADLFAFADQDDIWHPDKLRRHVGLLDAKAVDAVSSDVTAFWPTGRRVLIRKSFAQRRWDHLLEPPGPGCSFLMRAHVMLRCREVLGELAARGIAPLPYHDWMVYLVARASGMRWWIDDWPSLMYRQHARNEVGANVGWRALSSRLHRLAAGQYTRLVQQAIAISLLCDPRGGATEMRLGPLQLLLHGRRRWRDALVATLSMPKGVGVHIDTTIASHRAPAKSR